MHLFPCVPESQPDYIPFRIKKNEIAGIRDANDMPYEPLCSKLFTPSYVLFRFHLFTLSLRKL